jgi:hypothetical protein
MAKTGRDSSRNHSGRHISRRGQSPSSSRPAWPLIGVVGATALVTLVIAGLIFSTWGPRASISPSLGPLSDEWGPLAVSRDSMGGDAALLTGALRITESCVLLEGPDGSSSLLVWPRDQTRWDPRARQIQWRNLEGEVLELRDGQEVGLGGSGQLLSDDAISVEARSWDEWVGAVDWAAEPDPVCRADSSWSVGDVLLNR